jgi:hypothetical protein
MCDLPMCLTLDLACNRVALFESFNTKRNLNLLKKLKRVFFFYFNLRIDLFLQQKKNNLSANLPIIKVNVNSYA